MNPSLSAEMAEIEFKSADNIKELFEILISLALSSEPIILMADNFTSPRIFETSKWLFSMIKLLTPSLIMMNEKSLFRLLFSNLNLKSDMLVLEAISSRIIVEFVIVESL